MPSSAILDVAIGIAFVYLFLSLICSVVNEGIAAVLSLRSKNLVAGIDSLLSGTKLPDGRAVVELLYSHGSDSRPVQRSAEGCHCEGPGRQPSRQDSGPGRSVGRKG